MPTNKGQPYIAALQMCSAENEYYCKEPTQENR